MTVSQLHNYMTEKVVPESVMPQNIAACLIDENAQIPELDAFTFLNRVRALGIGSADFLYLLKGCDAPEEAIDKIENNPAMNLQGLVVTLESSGLTPKDYTRMLYTARQLWERTLTMQLDELAQAELPSDDDIISEALGEGSQHATHAKEEYSPVPDEESDIIEEDTSNLPEADSFTESEDADEFFGDEDLPENGDIENITEEYDEEYSYTSDEDEADEYRPEIDFGNHNREEEAKNNNTGKIVAASIGAAVLLGLSAMMNFMGFEKPTVVKPAAHFAADHQELFTEIHTAYNSGRLGGEEITPRSFTASEVFGNMLIEKPTADTNDLGVFSIGKHAFSAESNKMTVFESVDGVLAVKGVIPSPENTEFIEIITLDNKLCAIFKGEESAGFITYNENGDVLYSCNQQGILTDISIDEDCISLGTVYVPSFTESFNVQQTEKYMPVIQLDSKVVVIPPESIVANGSASGCGYAVFAEYSLENGEITESYAAIGDPVFAGAEQFTAVMKTTDGFEIIKLGQTQQTEDGPKTPILTETITNALSFDDGAVLASAEKNEDGSVNIYLRGEDFAPLSAVTNLPESFNSLKIDGHIMYICEDDSIIMVLDISDPANPAVVELSSECGIVSGDYALCSSTSSSLVKLTLYKKGKDGISEVSSYTKPLTLQDGEIPVMAGANTFLIIGEERCGAAYSYFDGVSVISEFGIFGKAKTSYTLFDDKNGFTEAAVIGNELHLIYGDNSILVK